MIHQPLLNLNRSVIQRHCRTVLAQSRNRIGFVLVNYGQVIGQIIQAMIAAGFTDNEQFGVRLSLAEAIVNGIKHGNHEDPAKAVQVRFQVNPQQVTTEIEDEGPGVPAELREAIFNRFHSVRPATESFGRHSGLGLAIARAIVEGHDGEIDVADRDDAPSGARFTIRLKAADQQ